MTGPVEQAAAARRGAGLFRPADRALIAITGDDRVRWLDGMLTRDVSEIQPGSGCYAVLLTHQGRIVADMNVLAREDAFWLEMAEQAAPAACECFEKHVIADDVAVVDVGGATDRIGVEGPNAIALLAALGGGVAAPEPDGWVDIRVRDVPVTAFRVRVTGTPGIRFIVPLGHTDSVIGALLDAGADHDLDTFEAVPEALEILRIEAGTPAFGAELDGSVLPAEARLDRAISHAKGCYVGQEVVARMQSSGRTSHLLVGVRFDSAPPETGAAVWVGDKRVGELTSCCVAPHAGPIGLAFVRSAHAAAGSAVVVGDVAATLSELPHAYDREPLS